MDDLLFTPIRIGARIAQNRIWLPAMVTWRGTGDGEVTDDICHIYRRYAEGGAGVLVLEAMGVRDVASGPLLRISDDRYLPGLQRLAREIRAANPDALILPQIIDFLKISTRKPTRDFLQGMVARGRLPPETLLLSDTEFEQQAPALLDPRALHDLRMGWRQTVGDLSEAEILTLPAAFAAAARRAHTAGFDGVELHMAHAYTLASFLSVTNPRRDRWGGSLENRLRLPRMVIAAVRAAVPPGFITGCRMLGAEDILLPDGSIGGNTSADAQDIAIALAPDLDFLSVSRGGRFDDAKQPPTGEAAYPYTGNSGHACIPRRKADPPAANVALAAAIRARLRAHDLPVPVIGAGKIATRPLSARLLEEGALDMVGMARALLADPDLPRKWQAGKEDSVRTCVFCPWCEQEDQAHRPVSCTLWPKVPGHPRARLMP